MKRINVQNPFSKAPVYYRDVTDSTMDDSKKDSSGEILHGTVYQAGFQKKGRGRIKSRDWHGDAGLNLAFTLLLKRSELKHELNHMPLIAGIALTSAVCEYSGLNFKLKWPNDLIFEGRKVGGILCEADSENFYCGIGVNCNQTSFSGDLEKKAASLITITGETVELSEILELFLKKISFYLDSGDSWREHLLKKLYKKGQIVEVLEGQADQSVLIKGEIWGIGKDGQLILRQQDGNISEIYAGEIEL
jgi:BirA family biotin operon repressor/biotin-[acetyl-CoA-carboxylase] ligase